MEMSGTMKCVDMESTKAQTAPPATDGGRRSGGATDIHPKMTTFDRSKKKAIIFQGRTTGRETKYANPFYEGTDFPSPAFPHTCSHFPRANNSGIYADNKPSEACHQG